MPDLQVECVDGLSPSSLDTWLTCPARFHFEKVAKVEQGPPSLAMLAGTAVHRVIELLMYVPHAQRTIDTARDHAARATLEAADELVTSGVNLLEFKRKVWAGVLGYFELEDPTRVNVAGTERRVDAEIEGVPLRGFIDRLVWEGGALVVEDFKNGKVPPPSFRAAKTRQLLIYGLILRELGTPARSGRLIYTTAREVVERAFTPSALDSTLEVAQRAWAEIHEAEATDVWEPSTGPLCGWCPFLALCGDGQATVGELHAAGRLRADSPGMRWVMDNSAVESYDHQP